MLRQRDKVEDACRGYGRRPCGLEKVISHSRNIPASNAATIQENHAGNAGGSFVDPVTPRFQRSIHVMFHRRTAVASSDGVANLTDMQPDPSIRKKGIDTSRL